MGVERLSLYWCQAQGLRVVSHGNEPLKLRIYLFFCFPLFLLCIWHGVHKSGRLFGNDLGDRTASMVARQWVGFHKWKCCVDYRLVLLIYQQYLGGAVCLEHFWFAHTVVQVCNWISSRHRQAVQLSAHTFNSLTLAFSSAVVFHPPALFLGPFLFCVIENNLQPHKYRLVVSR